MRFLRPIAGYTRLDRKRNNEIRQELEIETLNDTLTNYRTNWRQHVLRMEEHRIPKAAFNYRPQGRRNIGRPRKRWTQQNFG